MLRGSFSATECKFWNKKLGNSQFLITATSCVDNYFRSQSTRLKCGSIGNKMQFNGIANHESLQVILSKKLRGVKQQQSSQPILKSQIKFVNRQTYQSQFFTLEQIINFYINYKAGHLKKSLNSGRITQQLIKPFLKIYSSLLSTEHKISLNFQSSCKAQKQFNNLFNKILSQSQNCTHQFGQQFEPSDNHKNNGKCQHEKLQNYFNHTRQKTDKNILTKADLILKEIQDREEAKLRKRAKEDEANAKLEYRNRNGNILQGDFVENGFGVVQAKKNQRKNVANNGELTNNKMKTTSKKLKFKQLDEPENQNKNLQPKQKSKEIDDDYQQLCFELGLLISDTDKILKPTQ